MSYPTKQATDKDTIENFKSCMVGQKSTNWAVQKKNGEVTYGLKNSCFGALPVMSGADLAVYGTGLTMLSGRSAEDKAKILEYVDYLLNRSMFAEAFIDKDAEAVLTHGSQMDVNYHNPYLVCASQEIRLMTRNLTSTATWQIWFLLKDAVGERAAHILSRKITKVNSLGNPNDLWSPADKYGWTSGSNMRKAEFTNLINNKKYTKSLSPAKTSLRYYEQHRIWSNPKETITADFDKLPKLIERKTSKDSFGRHLMSFDVITCSPQEYAAALVEVNYLGSEFGA